MGKWKIFEAASVSAAVIAGWNIEKIKGYGIKIFATKSRRLF